MRNRGLESALLTLVIKLVVERHHAEELMVALYADGNVDGNWAMDRLFNDHTDEDVAYRAFCSMYEEEQREFENRLKLEATEKMLSLIIRDQHELTNRYFSVEE